MASQQDQSVEFAGNCSFAVSTGKKDVPGKESCYLEQDGKKYLFSNPVARFLWKIIPGRLKKANAVWLDK
jgi:hypothetical protein